MIFGRIVPLAWSVLCSLGLASVVRGQEPASNAQVNFVFENQAEFSTTGDWDGDGLVDLLLVDKASGFVRIGYQAPSLTYRWAEPAVLGLQEVSGCSAGVLLSPERHGLMATSPKANRLILLQPSGADVAPRLTELTAVGIGPTSALALPSANPVSWRNDLLIGSSLNGVPATQIEVLWNRTNTFQPAYSLLTEALWRQGNRVQLQREGFEYAAVLSGESTSCQFQIWQSTPAALLPIVALTNLPSAVRYLHGQFDETGFSYFLFYEPGQSRLLVRRIAQGGTHWNFGPPASYDVGQPIAQWFVLPGPNETRLLAIFATGEAPGAAVYSFNGRASPSRLHDYPSDRGQRFTGAAALPGGHFTLFSGGVDGRSTRFESYERTGSGYRLAQKGDLPNVAARRSAANVLFFNADPFSVPGALLIGTQRSGDWTSQMRFASSSGSATLQAESRGGESEGLHHSAAATVTVPAGARAGLANQLSPAISIFSFSPALGQTLDTVQVAPPSGSYATAIRVVLTAQHGDSVVYYRTHSASAWSVYAQPFFLTKTTMLEYFAQRPTGPRTAIAAAQYQFAPTTTPLDSDGDGIPDQVEAALGLDPTTSSLDADNDGVPDLSELLLGTDPTDPEAVPNLGSRASRDLQASFDLLVTPKPWDGRSGGVTDPAAGGLIRAFDLQGTPLASGSILPIGGPLKLPRPAAYLTNVLTGGDQRLVVVATEPHFAVVTDSLDRRIGREMIALLPEPTVLLPELDNHDQGGTAAMEAADWLTALRSATEFKRRQFAEVELTIESTLAALLLEQRIGKALVLRGESPTSQVTLFPFRPGDAGRIVLTADQIAGVERQLVLATGTIQPGYQLARAASNLQQSVTNSKPAGMRDLRQVAQTLYSISSLSNNTAPGRYAAPIDALRTVLEEGRVPDGYANDPRLPRDLVARAAAAGAEAVDAVPTRPVQTLSLQVVRSSATGGVTCTSLEKPDRSLAHLVDADGRPYRFKGGFQLLPGSVVHVTGYSDAIALCPGLALEVIDAALQAVPLAQDQDQDGNLLPDSWELLFFGLSGQDPFGDSDSDGYDNLQEYLEGSSPVDGRHRPGVAPVHLADRTIQVETSPDGQLHLSWHWPEAYSHLVRFGIRTSTDLSGQFIDHPVAPVHMGSGRFEAQIPAADSPQAFFFVSISLKP